MPNPITNHDDLIDSRDVIARIAELETITAQPDAPLTAVMELADLRALADEAEPYAGDWGYGTEVIRDSHFTDYARELADEVGLVDRDAPWPLCHIDWNAAADALRVDYVEIDFAGVRYWVR